MDPKHRILVVEDEAILAEALRTQLQQLGYDVVAVAYTGPEAIESAAETDPDLVIMDIMLRGEMDGIAAARQIRKKHRIPVVYITGFTNTRAFRLIKKLYPTCYLTKPFSLSELQAIVESALNGTI